MFQGSEIHPVSEKEESVGAMKVMSRGDCPDITSTVKLKKKLILTL